MKHEGQALINTDQVKRKIEDLKKAATHVFTNEEIDEMIEKKKAFRKIPVNVAAIKIRLQQEIIEAEQQGDPLAIQQKKVELRDLEEQLREGAFSKDSKLEQFSNLNARNRQINLKEGREAEKLAIQAKKKKDSSDYDPFARRKTAPKHVIQKTEEESDSSPKKKVHDLAKKKALKADVSPGVKPTLARVDEDDFLDSIDLSELEKDLKK
jgi:hypothetical protein